MHPKDDGMDRAPEPDMQENAEKHLKNMTRNVKLMCPGPQPNMFHIIFRSFLFPYGFYIPDPGPQGCIFHFLGHIIFKTDLVFCPNLVLQLVRTANLCKLCTHGQLGPYTGGIDMACAVTQEEDRV